MEKSTVLWTGLWFFSNTRLCTHISMFVHTGCCVLCAGSHTYCRLNIQNCSFNAIKVEFSLFEVAFFYKSLFIAIIQTQFSFSSLTKKKKSRTSHRLLASFWAYSIEIKNPTSSLFVLFSMNIPFDWLRSALCVCR